MDRYVVIGNPISHSLSPEIHARFARAEGDSLSYEAMPVPLGEFDSHARRFFAAGGRGANVTLPFKLDAFAFATRRSARADAAGAANVLAARDGAIEADNTDGAGLVADLRDNLGLDLSGKRILVLGAGGAARGVIAPLLALAPLAVVIANRTVERARDLAQRFGAPVQAVALAAIPPEPFDLVINATSGSTRGEALALDPAMFSPAVFAYDMAYGPAAAPFVSLARSRGAAASDGLGMLVEQAAESYLLWRGRRPATGEVLRELRQRLA
ncbi:MAG TPA: shikimate dehydrogenase [Usitatibacter sp.]|nr:shikimate dehydrogenase [Usitatibacter sp.]